LARLLKTFFDSGGPTVEALRDAFMEVALAIVNFQG
jgi:hypothetical protein